MHLGNPHIYKLAPFILSLLGLAYDTYKYHQAYLCCVMEAKWPQKLGWIDGVPLKATTLATEMLEEDSKMDGVEWIGKNMGHQLICIIKLLVWRPWQLSCNYDRGSICLYTQPCQFNNPALNTSVANVSCRYNSENAGVIRVLSSGRSVADIYLCFGHIGFWRLWLCHTQRTFSPSPTGS